MTVTATASKGLRIGNEAYLSGAEVQTATLGQIVNASIPAATHDHPVVVGAFTKANLVGLLMMSTQDGMARMSGGNPWVIQNIATLGDLVLGVGGTFTILNDQTAWIYPGDMFWIEGCTTAANDGLYMVIDSTFAAGVTTIEVVRQTAVINAAVVEVFDTVEAGAGAACLATKIMAMSPKHYIDAGDDFTVAGPPGQIEIAEDLSALVAHDRLLIQEATNAANNQLVDVTTATFVAPDTTLVVEEAVAVEAGNAAANLMLVRSEFHPRLVANVPTLWTLPSGILNPCLEDITTLLVTNDHPTAGADFQARIVTGPL